MTPLELIVARNLVSSLELAAVLLDPGQSILFYNEAAADFAGARFEESGPMAKEEWQGRFGPLSSDGTPMSADELPLVRALREGRPAHARLRFRVADGVQEVEASGLPLIGPTGYQGALVVLWPADASAVAG